MIIILNGSKNSGKTTIAKILQNKIPNTAHIEVDNLRDFVGWMDGEAGAYSLSIENAALITKNFVKHGLNVIFTYLLEEDDYNNTIQMLSAIDTKIYFFTLNPDISVVLTNRGNRELSSKEQERIRHHYKIGTNKPSFGQIIDNTNQTAEETANTILEAISK
ncbi:MAG: hypothetical protein ACD_22C00097G0001 [uncultured bacterium]|nr:MAG: hypothetical protein ACD_22C00097G0001 [uncultured bacterium]